MLKSLYHYHKDNGPLPKTRTCCCGDCQRIFRPSDKKNGRWLKVCTQRPDGTVVTRRICLSCAPTGIYVITPTNAWKWGLREEQAPSVSAVSS